MLGYYIMSEDISGSSDFALGLPAYCEYSESDSPFNIRCKYGVKNKPGIILTDSCTKCNTNENTNASGGRSRRRRSSNKRKSNKKRSIRRKRR